MTIAASSITSWIPEPKNDPIYEQSLLTSPLFVHVSSTPRGELPSMRHFVMLMLSLVRLRIFIPVTRDTDLYIACWEAQQFGRSVENVIAQGTLAGEVSKR